MPEVHLYSISAGVYEDAGKCLPVSYAMVDTPYGRAFLGESCGRIVYLSLGENEAQGLNEFQKRWHLTKPSHRPEHCQRMINSVFDTKDPLSCARLLVLGTDFQISVWEALVHVEEGTVVTYKDIAEKIGQPDAVRAVANAISDNPVAHLIPCHRVVRTDGTLGGYRWGLESKKNFLAAEGIDLARLSAA